MENVQDIPEGMILVGIDNIEDLPEEIIESLKLSNDNVAITKKKDREKVAESKNKQKIKKSKKQSGQDISFKKEPIKLNVAEIQLNRKLKRSLRKKQKQSKSYINEEQLINYNEGFIDFYKAKLSSKTIKIIIDFCRNGNNITKTLHANQINKKSTDTKLKAKFVGDIIKYNRQNNKKEMSENIKNELKLFFESYSGDFQENFDCIIKWLEAEDKKDLVESKEVIDKISEGQTKFLSLGNKLCLAVEKNSAIKIYKNFKKRNLEMRLNVAIERITKAYYKCKKNIITLECINNNIICTQQFLRKPPNCDNLKKQLIQLVKIQIDNIEFDVSNFYNKKNFNNIVSIKNDKSFKKIEKIIDNENSILNNDYIKKMSNIYSKIGIALGKNKQFEKSYQYMDKAKTILQNRGLYLDNYKIQLEWLSNKLKPSSIEQNLS